MSITVKTDPILEAIARKLHGFGRVPPEEQNKMIARAVDAAREAAAARIAEQELALKTALGRISDLEVVIAAQSKWAIEGTETIFKLRQQLATEREKQPRECDDCASVGELRLELAAAQESNTALQQELKDIDIERRRNLLR